MEKLQQFRWRELFSVDRHNEEIDELVQKRLAVEHKSAEIKQQLNNLDVGASDLTLAIRQILIHWEPQSRADDRPVRVR